MAFPELEQVFDAGYTRPDPAEYIHAAILFADMENSVMLSSALEPMDFDVLMQAFQSVMLGVAEDLRGQGLPLAELRIEGDQLAIYFYDPGEVERNREFERLGPEDSAEKRALKEQWRKSNNELAYNALWAAIEVKNRWLTQPFNQARLKNRREPVGIGIGIHTGRVYLRDRPDGRRRIEGYTINLAKRVEGFARQGKFSRIMFSQDARNRIRGMLLRHSQLSQRIFFHQHDASMEIMKGVAETQPIYELRFFSRLKFRPTAETVSQYEALFFLNHNNLWAYYQLFEYFGYEVNDWNRVFELATLAHIVHPRDEKILLDLARCYIRQEDFLLAKEFALRAVQLNDELDLAYELLAEIAGAQGDGQSELSYMVKAVQLAPRSPMNNYSLGVILCDIGRKREGAKHIQYALESYPALAEEKGDQALITALKEQGLLKVPAAQ